MSGLGLAPSALLNFYTHHSVLKPARKVMPQGPQQCRKKCVTFLTGGGGGAPEERPYDVSHGQNRYVTLSLSSEKVFNKYL